MSYSVEISDEAGKDLVKLKKNLPRAYDKAMKLIKELYSTPRTGTGHPEQ